MWDQATVKISALNDLPTGYEKLPNLFKHKAELISTESYVEF